MLSFTGSLQSSYSRQTSAYRVRSGGASGVPLQTMTAPLTAPPDNALQAHESPVCGAPGRCTTAPSSMISPTHQVSELGRGERRVADRKEYAVVPTAVERCFPPFQ